VLVGVVLIMMENEIEIDKDEKLLIFLMIIPICRLAELFFNFSFFWNTLIFYLMVISLVIYYAIKLKIKSWPFIGNPSYLLIVAFVGGVLSLFAKQVLHLEFVGLIFLIPIIAYAEEIYFRGGFQNLAKDCFGSLAILFTALLYAAFCISYGFTFVLIAFFAALVLSTLYHFTKNLYLTFALNIIFHVVVFLFFPFNL
jgi:membrane protease YdiL (CAAX protease family)